jgi:PAS domain S-box-containing protein
VCPGRRRPLPPQAVRARSVPRGRPEVRRLTIPTNPINPSTPPSAVESSPQALLRSEERFHLLVDAVRDYAIFILDPTGHVSTWNTGAERIKGYTAAEIVGSHFSRFYPPEAIAARSPWRLLEEAIRSGRVEEENWRVRKDGTLFWASVVITALRDHAGTLVGFAKVTRDLTERRRAEEERRQLLAAEEAARLRGEFLSVAAHELKTPLTSLLGMAQLAHRRYVRRAESPPEGLDTALDTIVAQSRKLSRLIDQLLDVSRLEAGKLALDRRETDLAVILTSVQSLFQTRDDAARLELDLPPQPVNAFVDTLRLEQVVTNLIDNALKYSPLDTPVHVSLTALSGFARIAVRDRGPGVPVEDRAHLFDRFFRSRASGYTSGMGLGLYVSREIVELHGGSITAEFPPDGGAQFVVDIPTSP